MASLVVPEEWPTCIATHLSPLCSDALLSFSVSSLLKVDRTCKYVRSWAPLQPNCTSKDRYLYVYNVTTAFLTAIARVRRSEQLPSLDGCPHYDYNPAPAPDRLPDGDNRLQAARQAAPLVALAAPLPLDTG